MCRVLGSSWVRCREWPCGCGAGGFLIFSGLFFRCRFREFEDDRFKLPSFSLRGLLFLRFLRGFGVNATLHVCFRAVGPKPFFLF